MGSIDPSYLISNTHGRVPPMRHDDLLKRFTGDYRSYLHVKELKLDIDKKAANNHQAQSSDSNMKQINTTLEDIAKAISNLSKALIVQAVITNQIMEILKGEKLEDVEERISALEFKDSKEVQERS